MLDELQFRRTSDNGSTLPRTIYLPELDMEVVVLPPAYAPGRELPSNAADIDSRVKFLKTSMTFGGVSFPKPYSLPKPPRYDRRLMFLRFPNSYGSSLAHLGASLPRVTFRPPWRLTHNDLRAYIPGLSSHLKAIIDGTHRAP